MKRVSLWLAVYLLAMLVMMPAKVLYWLPLPAGVSLAQAQGSLWQGSLGTLQVQQVLLRDLSWDWNLSALLLGQVQADVQVPAQNNNLALSSQVTLGIDKLALDDLKASGNLASVLQLADVSMPLKTRGNWTLAIAGFAVEQPSAVHWCDDLQGSARGMNIQVLVNNVWQPLGDFPLQLGCQQPGLISISMDGNNNLGLALEGTMNGDNLAVAGTVKPSPRTPTALAQLFTYLGQPDNQGRYRFSL
ncbi:MAG: type II secretion system protein N [Pseudomonadota bacterium]